MCYIKKNDQFQILDNGLILFKNKTYSLGECKFEDEAQAPHIIEDVEVDLNDTRNNAKHETPKKEPSDEPKALDDSKKEKSKKERKEKKEKKPNVQTQEKKDDDIEVPQKEENNVIIPIDASINVQPSQMELDMGLPVLLMPQTQQPQAQVQPQAQPQALPQTQSQTLPAMTPQQFQQWQQFQQLQMQQIQQQLPSIQLPQNVSMPQIALPNLTPQGLEPSQPIDTTKTTESHIPQEFHMLQDFIKMTGGNLYLAVALVVGVIFYKQWKINQDKKNEQPSDAHSQACDQERKDLGFKVRVLEDRTQVLHQLEQRVQSLEESQDEGGINIGFSEEIENRIEALEKHLKDVNKKLNQASASIDTTSTVSIEKPKREYTRKVTSTPNDK
jgi:hypothetical protein